jgi:hypothetical protein
MVTSRELGILKRENSWKIFVPLGTPWGKRKAELSKPM